MSTLNLTTYRAGLRQMLGSVWPEIDRNLGGGGIFTAARIKQVSLEDIRTDQDTAITTTAIIEQAQPTRAEEWSGLTNQIYSVETQFHYVRRRDMTTDLEEFVEARLLALEQYLLYTGPPFGQCLRVEGIDALDSNTINAMLLEKNKAYYGGTLTAVMLVGHDAL